MRLADGLLSVPQCSAQCPLECPAQFPIGEFAHRFDGHRIQRIYFFESAPQSTKCGCMPPLGFRVDIGSTASLYAHVHGPRCFASGCIGCGRYRTRYSFSMRAATRGCLRAESSSEHSLMKESVFERAVAADFRKVLHGGVRFNILVNLCSCSIARGAHNDYASIGQTLVAPDNAPNLRHQVRCLSVYRFPACHCTVRSAASIVASRAPVLR